MQSRIQVLLFLFKKRLTVNVAPPERKRIELIGSGATALPAPKLGFFEGMLNGGMSDDRARNDGILAGGKSKCGAPRGGVTNGGTPKDGVSTGGVMSGGVSRNIVRNGGMLSGGASNRLKLNGSCAFEILGNVNISVKTINIVLENILFIFHLLRI